MAESQPIRALPARPSIEFLKKTAKERLDALRAVDASAQLADAQLALAREFGFPNWRALAAKIEADQPRPDKEDLHKRFRSAVNAGLLDDVKQLLQTNPELANAPIFSFGSRPIHQAKANVAMLDLLLSRGADINLKSDWPPGPWGVLEMADEQSANLLIQRGAVVDVFAAAHLNKLDGLRELLDADPSLVHSRGGDGCLPLHFATSAEAIDLLLSRGAEIDARDVDHESTAAQWAVPRPPGQGPDASSQSDRRLSRVRMLVDRGATVDVFMAAALNDVKILTTILDHDSAAINRRVGDSGYALCPEGPGRHIYIYSLVEGKTPFQIAAEFGSDECSSLLLAKSTPRQRFLAACTTGDEPRAREVLSQEPQLIATLSPSERGLLAGAAWAGNAPAVKLMLDLGFDPIAPGPDTGTALHCAAWQGRREIVRMILSHERVLARRDELVNAIEPTHQAKPFGWCCHGSINCRNPAGDYPAVAKELLAAGAIPDPNRSPASDAVEEAIARFNRSRES
jgi:ankyrin repeat protein